MMYDRFMIGPYETGLQTNSKPWMIADDAFANLQNVYVFRDRVRKRFGSEVMGTSGSTIRKINSSRLRVSIGSTDASGNFGPAVISVFSTVTFAIGQQFSIAKTVDGEDSDEVFTIESLGVSATIITTGTSVMTFDTTIGSLQVTGATPLSTIYFYPMLPVMGIATHEEAITNDELTYAFDTVYAYQFAGGSWSRLEDAVWTGDNSQFFWSCNYRGVTAADTFFFTTNYNDNVKYYVSASTTWTTFTPEFNVDGDTIDTCRIIIPFKDRLLFLNVVELISSTPSTVVNRLRFSQNGSPVESDAWRQDIAGKGGFLDAPTKEAIISAQVIKDRLIVFFERSTWEVVFTYNQIQPFVWQQINIELGAESTFSIVPFDKVLIGMGNVGIHACNGANVERIDQKIPNSVFELLDLDQGPDRVSGIRDYFTEMIYWTFPVEGNTFPQKILVYNYANGSWAFNDDSITTFGYYQQQTDETWESTDLTWEESDETWASGTQQAGFRQVVGGNQQGFVLILNSLVTSNAPSLSITNITYNNSIGLATITCINHNLTPQDYVLFENVQGITGLNNIIFQVNSVIDANSFIILLIDVNDDAINLSGTYTGAGTLSRVSKINIVTKQWNPYAKQGRNIFISKIDFNVDKTENGQIVVDYFPSFSEISMISDATTTGSLLGSSILETSPYDLVPFEQQQEQLWHSLYFQTDGETIQLNMYLNDFQLRTNNIALSDFQLNAMVLYCLPVGRLQ